MGSALTAPRCLRVCAAAQSRKVRGTAPLSQASTALHLGDVLQRANNMTVQQWRPEDMSKVRRPRCALPLVLWLANAKPGLRTHLLTAASHAAA